MLNSNEYKRVKTILINMILLCITLLYIFIKKIVIAEYILAFIGVCILFIYLCIKLIFQIIELIDNKKRAHKLLKQLKNYKIFKNAEEIETWAKDYYGESLLEEIKAYYDESSADPYYIGWYKGAYSHVFSFHPYAENSQILRSYICWFTINENIITYRYCAKNEYRTLLNYRKCNIKRFFSTTLLPQVFNGNGVIKDNLIKIIVPKGTHGLYLPNKSSYDLEFEILFPTQSELYYIGETYYNNDKIKTFLIKTYPNYLFEEK